MLTLTLNGKSIVTDRNTSVKMKWENPACYFDEIPGDRGLGLEISANEHTKPVYGNPERFEKRGIGDSGKFPNLECRFSGSLLIRGTHEITNATSKKYSGFINSNLGVLGDEQKEKFINEHEAFEEEVTFTNKTIADDPEVESAWHPDVDLFACPAVFNPFFYQDRGKIITLYLDKYGQPITKQQYDVRSKKGQDVDTLDIAILRFRHEKSYALGMVNMFDDNGYVLTGDSEWKLDDDYDSFHVYPVTPYFYLHHVLKMILKKNKFFFSNNNFLKDNADLYTLCLYNNYDITPMSYSIVDITVIAPTFNIDEGFTPSLHGKKFYGKAVSNIYRKSVNGIGFKPKNHLPKMSLKDAILATQNITNTCFYFHTDNKVDVIDREAILTGAAFDLDKYFIDDWVIGEKKNVTLKFTVKHDSNDTVFSDTFSDLDNRRKDFKEPVELWDDLEAISNPELGEIRYVKLSKVYAEYKYISETAIDYTDNNIERTYDVLGWIVISIGFQNGYYNYGRDEEEVIDCKFSTIPHKENWFPKPPLGFAHQQGNTAGIVSDFSNFTPRIFFHQGENETENLSLDLEKEGKGIIAKRYKYWAPFWARRLVVKCELNLPLNVLLYVRDNITQKYKTRQGEFIIKTMETTFEGSNMSTTTIEGFKVDVSGQSTNYGFTIKEGMGTVNISHIFAEGFTIVSLPDRGSVTCAKVKVYNSDLPYTLQAIDVTLVEIMRDLTGEAYETTFQFKTNEDVVHTVGITVEAL